LCVQYKKKKKTNPVRTIAENLGLAGAGWRWLAGWLAG
jgi:hypothetical protein